MRHYRHGIGYHLFLLLLCAFPLSSALATTFYTLSDFQWYVRHADGSKQRTELLSQLSRRQVLAGILWSDATERDRKRQNVRAFLQQPRNRLPAFRQVRPGPGSSTFATYVITVDEQSLAGPAVLLNTLHNSLAFDYALPVLQLSRGAAAPFIEFTVVFSAASEAQARRTFLRRQPVVVLSQNDTTYTLRLNPQIATNILAVIRAFEEASSLVEDVRPVWFDIEMLQPVNPSDPVPVSPVPVSLTSDEQSKAESPGTAGESASKPQPTADVTARLPAIEAKITLDTGWGFPLVDVRHPIIYGLQIEYHENLRILPESIAPSALQRALTRETALPSELFDITETNKQTEQLPNARRRTRVEYILRISKPGTYRLPALLISYSGQPSRRAVQHFQSLPPEGYLLTVDAHLPVEAQPLPGDILLSRPLLRRLWPGFRHLGPSMLMVGLLLLGASLVLRTPRRQQPVKPKRRSPRQIRQQYQTAFQTLQETMPSTPGVISPETRAWLRHCATLLRRLIGERAVGDPTWFEGGAGVSKGTIMTHLPSELKQPDGNFQAALELIEEFNALATAPKPSLSSEDYQRLCEAMQQTILLLTNNEASRVLRLSRSL